MPSTAVFRRGEIVLQRGLGSRGNVVDAKPLTVVEDAPGRLVLWLPPGTPTLRAVLREDPGSGPRRWADGTWDLVPSVWTWPELLMITVPGESRSTWVCWEDDHRFRGWYVNLQAPLVRTAVGIDVRDHQLDVIVSPDRSWRLKDEDELRVAVDLGRMSESEAQGVREEARRVIDDIESNRNPFCDRWHAWTPSTDLPRPQFPADGAWDRLLPIPPPRVARRPNN